MCEIFISHIHEDKMAADAISRFLNSKLHSAKPPSSGSKVFLSDNQFQVRLGDDWLSKIHSALNSSKVVVALFSEVALVRPWVHFEAGGAWFSERRLIPICLGNLHPSDLPKPYSNIQGCNLHDSGAPYYLYETIYHSLHPGGIGLAPWLNDEDEQALQTSLAKWRLNQTTEQNAGG
jgi:hypothetical protein